MTVLVTGGCGFLGCNLAREAIRRKHRVIVLDNLQRTGSETNLSWLRAQGEIEFVRADARDKEAMVSLVRDAQPSVAFHLAGQVAMTTSIQDPRSDFETNVLGSLNLLEAARLHHPSMAIIYSSTNKVYGDLSQYRYEETATRYVCTEYPGGYDESVPLSFHSPYGCSKGAADQYMLDYHRTFGLKTAVLRHSSMYGGRQFSTYDQGWVGWFCQEALASARERQPRVLQVSGDGKQVRDVLHADDVVRLYFAIADEIEEAAGEAFNVGGGIHNSLSIRELFAFLERSTRRTISFRSLPWRESDQKVFVADNAKVTRLTGWKPRIGCEEGLARMLEWVKAAATGSGAA